MTESLATFLGGSSDSLSSARFSPTKVESGGESQSKVSSFVKREGVVTVKLFSSFKRTAKGSGSVSVSAAGSSDAELCDLSSPERGKEMNVVSVSLPSSSFSCKYALDNRKRNAMASV